MLSICRLALYSFFGLFCASSLLAQAQNEVILILNMENVEVVPKRFRSTSDVLEKNNQVSPPDDLGLKELHASGSGQFSQKSLDAIIKHLNHPQNMYVVDLRQESHGFMNGIAASWYAFKDWGNKGKNLQQINEIETNLLNNALKEKNVTIQKVISKNGAGLIDRTSLHDVVVENVSTESQLVQSKGIKYVRIPVTDHLKPAKESVDRFVALIRELPKDAWLHVHCAAGQGRTTTFLSMYDMMRNAKQVSFADILNRQWLLGGLRFEKTPNPANWKYESALDRLDFLKSFYQYCKENDDNFKSLWSEFVFG